METDMTENIKNQLKEPDPQMILSLMTIWTVKPRFLESIAVLKVE